MKNIIICVAGAIIIGLISLHWISSTHDSAVHQEEVIQQLYKKSESTLSNYTIGIMEQAKIPQKYKADILEIIKANMSGRYGENGSGAVVQFMNEQNIQIDPKVYLNLQNAMISGRKEFKLSQDLLLESCRSYKVQLNSFFTGKIMSYQNFPKIDLNKFCEAVSDKNTKEVFETKEQKPVSIE